MYVSLYLSEPEFSSLVLIFFRIQVAERGEAHSEPLRDCAHRFSFASHYPLHAVGGFGVFLLQICLFPVFYGSVCFYIVECKQFIERYVEFCRERGVCVARIGYYIMQPAEAEHTVGFLQGGDNEIRCLRVTFAACVVCLQGILFDNGYQAFGILRVGGIAAFLKSACPAGVVFHWNFKKLWSR